MDEPMEMLLAALKDDERPQFIRFITILRDVKKVNYALINNVQSFRFYVGNKKNVEAALEGIHNNLMWRANFPFDQLNKGDTIIPQRMREYVASYYYGTDLMGRPLRIIQPRYFDPEEILKGLTEEEFVSTEVQRLERLINIILPICSKQANRHIEGGFVIVDVKDANIKGLIFQTKVTNFFKKTVKLFQPNYPEITYKTIIINAGILFSGVWKIMTMFLNQQTIDKFTILGTNYMPELLKHTTIDRLPAELGGTCPYPIGEYPNAFDNEILNSIAEKRLGFATQ